MRECQSRGTWPKLSRDESKDVKQNAKGFKRSTSDRTGNRGGSGEKDFP